MDTISRSFRKTNKTEERKLTMNITWYDTGKKACCQFQKQNETAKLESSKCSSREGWQVYVLNSCRDVFSASLLTHKLRSTSFNCTFLGTTSTNQNSIQAEIKSRLKLGNACYYSVQNLLSSRLLSKNLKIKIHRTNFACCFVWVWSLVADIEGGT
jgi:hypothetical protein